MIQRLFSALLILILMSQVAIANPQLYFVHNDHLGTPQVITDENQNVVWQADYTPFGEATIQVEQITNNIRFPGQYYDAETGLHYNYFRDYDPSLGRYVEADPRGILRDFSDPQRQIAAQMGLPIPGYGYVNGLNPLYGYAGQNPLMYTDPTGENPVVKKVVQKALKKANIQVDGPSAGLKHGNGRVFGIRYNKKKQVFRLDYQPYPGTNGESRLHCHIGESDKHIPLDPRNFFD